MRRATLEDILKFFDSLRGTVFEGKLVLAGSSGLFGFNTTVQPYTEDVDLIIEEVLVRDKEDELIAVLSKAGFRHLPETATFMDEDGHTFDLIAYSTESMDEAVGGGRMLRVMVFGDISRIIRQPDALQRTPEGVVALSPAAFAVAKIMTVRETKSAKDKLQALGVIAEHGDDSAFRQRFLGMFTSFADDRQEDAVSDTYAAILTLTEDPLYREGEISDYREYLDQMNRGYETLRRWLEDRDAP